jgi:hypothetical protein
VKRSLIIKLAAGLVGLAVFGFLFMRTLEDARATPYTVERQHLRSWALALEPATRANEPLLVLRPAPELTGGLFRQVFARAMETLNAPGAPGMPIVLRGEYDRVVGDQLTQEALIGAARTAGLEQADLTPRCLVHRRISQPGGTRQAYLVFFDAPAIGQFRRQLGLDPDALSPILFVAGADADFTSWLPLHVSADVDCLAPIEVAN